eukprot:4137846-Heterocapsa_arctica.AAC.1
MRRPSSPCPSHCGVRSPGATCPTKVGKWQRHAPPVAAEGQRGTGHRMTLKARACMPPHRSR